MKAFKCQIITSWFLNMHLQDHAEAMIGFKMNEHLVLPAEWKQIWSSYVPDA